MQELLHNFGVDWKLLAAQVVNFLILLYLLNRFAFKPILRLLEKRRRDVEKAVKFSQTAERKLEEAEAQKAAIIKEAGRQAVKLVTEAEGAANRRKEEMLKVAASERDQFLVEGRESLKREKNKALDDLRLDAEKLVRRGLEKVLGQLPPPARDGRLISRALEEVRNSHGLPGPQ